MGVMAIPESHQEVEERRKREEMERGLARFGRRMVELRIAMKKERKIRTALGTAAFRHIHASDGELKERLLKIFDGAKFIIPTDEEIMKELEKLKVL